jgi:methylglyoxal reductase
MEMRTLGKNGPGISVVGYGAWEAGGDMWGPNESDDRVIGAMRAALDAGTTWMDTAEAYGRGRSEQLVARAIEGRRGEVLIFTKVAPSVSGFRPHQIKKAIRASLQRLQTDHVDLYQLHWPDRNVPVEDSWGAMAEIQDEGLARHIGVSNHDRALIERCLAIRHVDSVQNQFSLLHSDDRADLLPWLREQGVGYLAYAPLAYGMLTGAITPDTRFSDQDWRSGKQFQSGNYKRLFAPGARQRNVQLVERMEPIAERLGTSVAALAIRWVIEQRGVIAAIAGSRDPDHARQNAEAGVLELDQKTLRELDTIFS